MKKDARFYVIGGQYEWCRHGSAPTLLGAKRLAGKSKERWDNWQGWHIPAIYAAEDTQEAETFCCPAGTRVPKAYAVPVAYGWIENGRIRWENTKEMIAEALEGGAK